MNPTSSPVANSAYNFRLDGKNAVITGGASGIGQAIAESFAAAGARVHILDVNDEGAHAVARQIGDSGSSVRAYACDATDPAKVERIFGELAGNAPVHILVNSIGMAHIGTIETTSPADFEQVFRVNVESYYHCMRAVIGPMKHNGGGIILNIASIAASAGIADRFAYSMSKGAVLAMTYSVAKDYVKDNIRCNSISPARVHTPFVDGFIRKNYPGREEEMYRVLAQSAPIGRMAKPAEVASLALFLCSDQASFITGADYPLDGGFFNLRG